MSVATENKAGVPIPPASEHQPQPHAASKSIQLPPSPPETVDGDDTKSTSSASAEADYPLPPPANPQPQVLDVDKPTPDAHVPRDSRLIRLTGVHPFNVEAPLTDLYNEGFLTSPELFYVRNHGAVPEVQDSECLDWEFSVEGYANLHDEDMISKLTPLQHGSKPTQNYLETIAGRV
jgi:nitrate reductase (NAD(P)H)